MLRFINLSGEYWTDPVHHGGPMCAFLFTSDDRFVENEDGQHIFSDLDEIREHRHAARMESLLPPGFFEGRHVPIKELVYEILAKDDLTINTLVKGESYQVVVGPTLSVGTGETVRDALADALECLKD